MAIFYLAFLPFLFFLSFKQKYKDSIPARFWLKNNNIPKEADIYFHACSLGETTSLKPILEKLNKNTALSVTTQTGYKKAKEILGDSAFYLPFEIFLPFVMPNIKILVVLEAEFWWMLFFMAKRKGAKTIMLNARISSKSMPKYMRFRWLYKTMFKDVDFIYTQSSIDKHRFELLGAKNIEVLGNIKILNEPKILKHFDKPKNPIFVAGSTHSSEEFLITEAFIKAYSSFETKPTLIIVPRHPERFKALEFIISGLAKSANISYATWSENQNFDTNIILFDAMGELNGLYEIATLVILGGSFATIGGHNPLEPAFFNCKIISGEHIFNQYALFDLVKGVKFTLPEELCDDMKNYQTLENTSFTQNITIDDVLKIL